MRQFFLALLLMAVAQQAGGYSIELLVRAGPTPDPDQIEVALTEYDGATEGMIETGQYVSETGGIASATVSVDLATGSIRGSMMSSGDATDLSGSEITNGASANGGFIDTLNFTLDPGVTSVTIGFQMTLEGNDFGNPVSTGGLVIMQLGDTMVLATSGTCGGGGNITNCLLPQLPLIGEVTITEDTSLEVAVFVGLGVSSFTNTSGGFEFLNTATFALQPLPEGVSFTSESGVFNSVVSTADDDADGVPNSSDNCTAIANVEQRDTDSDGIGNSCDPDVDGAANCFVNFLDLNVYRANFFQAGDLDTDNNGDGLTNFLDLNVVRDFFFSQPGPSANGCN